MERLRQMEAESVHCCVTSVPYWGLRDYQIPPSVWGGNPTCDHVFGEECSEHEMRKGAGFAELGKRMKGGGHKQAKVENVRIVHGFCERCGAWRGCLGLEPTYQLYVEHITEVFREVWRVLRKDGTLWINLGDCYANSRAGWSAQKYWDGEHDNRTFRDKPFDTFAPKGSFARNPGGTAVTNNGRVVDWGYRSRGLQGSDAKGRRTPGKADGAESNEGGAYHGPLEQPNRMPQPGLKQKDLAGMPWRVAFALQDDGWWLRRDIIWHKLNPMPESIYDRPTTSHEYIFLFSKSGDTLLWRHRDGRVIWKQPEPDFIWRHRETRLETAVEPKRHKKKWIRVNLWRGFDYYYDAEAIMEPSSPNSHARASRSRSKTHKNADGGPGKQTIAKNSPVAGRLLPIPAGWDFGEGRHGSIHRDGRRQEVGIGHNARPRKALPNSYGGKQPGKNSRAFVDRTPRQRKGDAHPGTFKSDGPRPRNNANYDAAIGTGDLVHMRNKRSVWPIATKPYKGAHFATFPPKLIEPCILAGCPRGGTVLDPFGGAGTTGLVAVQHQRHAILIELNPQYAEMAAWRLREAALLADVIVEAVPIREAAE